MYPQDLRENWHAGQGRWKDVPAAEWNDWHWQLRNRITTLAQLEEHVHDGLLQIHPGELVLLPQGHLMMRSAAMAFDAYLGGEQKGRFSRTV